MATRQKTTRPTKREMVMSFDGEENFIIPKKGGFGQPDNENYAMLTTSTTLGEIPDTTPNQPTQTGQGLGTSTIESGNTTSTHSPTQTTTTQTPTTTTSESTLTPLANLPTTTIGTDTIPKSTTTTPPKQLEEVETPPPSNTSNLPTFPNWSTLDCTTLRSEIDSLKNTMSTAKYTDSTILNAYNTQLALGEATYISKCNTPSTPPTPTTPSTTPIAIVNPESTSGGGGGGIGGGFGEPPSDATPTEEAPKPNNKKSLLVLLGVIGLIYLLTKKSK
jgi:hypothetical protein